MRAVVISAAMLGKVWPIVEPWIAAALSRHGDHSAQQVREHLERGTMQLWLAWGHGPVGCCVTEIIESPRGKACNLVVVAGKRFDAWAHLEADVAEWAQSWGVVRLTLTGRKGWVRRLAGTGWNETAVRLEKRIG